MDLPPLPQTADLPILLFRPVRMQDTRNHFREIVCKAPGAHVERYPVEGEPPAPQSIIFTPLCGAGGLVSAPVSEAVSPASAPPESAL